MAQIPIRILPTFAVPYAEAKHPDCNAMNAELKALFLAREGEGARYRNPDPTMPAQPGMFESEFRLFDWPEPCVRQLREFCWTALFHTIGQLNGHSQEVLQKMQVVGDAWFHVTRRNAYFGLHNHPMASWSGVYCVDAGEDDGDNPESGVLSFPHPIPGAGVFVDMSVARMKPPFAVSARHVKLAPGSLVIFPSWLMHQVLPFKGNGERITVAFNAWFKFEGKMPAPAGAG